MENQNNGGDNLIERAMKASEFKMPSAPIEKTEATTSTSTTSATETKTEAAPKNKVKASKAWMNLENNLDLPKIEEEEETEEAPKVETEKPKPDAKLQEASADTATSMLDLVTTTVFFGVELYRYKNAFTSKGIEWKKVKNIIHEDKSKLSDDDKLLFERVIKAQKKFKARKDEIAMDDEQYERKKRAFFHYYKTTGKTLDPAFMFWGNIITHLGEQITGTLMDDGY